MWNSVLPAYDSGFIGEDADMNVKGFFGEDFPYVFRPFHKAEAAGVDIVVEADVEGFGRLFDAVEVEMEDAIARGRAVFVMKVVFPAPMGAWKATRVRLPSSERNSLAAASMPERSFMVKLCNTNAKIRRKC